MEELNISTNNFSIMIRTESAKPFKVLTAWLMKSYIHISTQLSHALQILSQLWFFLPFFYSKVQYIPYHRTVVRLILSVGYQDT